MNATTSLTQIAQDHARIRQEATRLAGRPGDLVQRAQVYLQIYRVSGGRHVFPLLAAHGALWGAGHFRRGQMLARVLSLPVRDRGAKLERLAAFAEAFKDINRRVCIETYSTYHLTALHGVDAAISVGMDATLAQALNACHTARRDARPFDTLEKHALFSAFFLWEQNNVVQDAIEEARSALNWPLMDLISMRPPIRFAYFDTPTVLMFRRFQDKNERILQGQRAFAIAETKGWDHVENRARTYNILPEAAFQNPTEAYRTLLNGIGLRPLTAAS